MNIEAAKTALLQSIHAAEIDIGRVERRFEQNGKLTDLEARERLRGKIDGIRETIAQLDALTLAVEWPADDTIALPRIVDAPPGFSLVHDALIEPVRVVGIVIDSTRYTVRSLRVGVRYILNDYRPTQPNVPRPITNTEWAYPGQVIELRIERADRCADHDECRINDAAHQAQAAMCSLAPSFTLFVERRRIADAFDAFERRERRDSEAPRVSRLRR